MVSTVVFGGLGNQLFIYATARALALRLGTELALNTTRGFKDDVLFHRGLELDSFNVSYVHDRLSTFDYAGGKAIRRISRLIGRNLLSPSCVFLRDQTDNTGTDRRLLTFSSKNAFLEGYWQSPDYFEDYADTIRDDLRIVVPVSEQALSLEKEMFASDEESPVCVGVRRYQECTTSQMLGTLSIVGEDFYHNAVNKMKQLVAHPVFYVFTQDREWAASHLAGKLEADVRIVDNNGNRAIDDLYLMTKFKHHIISNSSFYWWGAWLARGETVISTASFHNQTSNCKDWIVI